MNATITEWEFTGDAASWINEIIEANRPSLPFSRAKIEQRSRGSRKRRDLTILGTTGEIILTGEVKMPWAKGGHSPFVDALVRDARKKAENAGSPWFFSWNASELVLWRTNPENETARSRHFKRYQIAPVGNASDFENDYVIQSLREGIAKFVLDFALIVTGDEELHRRPPDEYFIESLESFLERPIEIARFELMQRASDPSTRELIERWMVKDQGWTLAQDDQENWNRAARFASYAVVNKLVFYEALRRRFATLPVLRIPAHISTGERAFEHLATYFSIAKDVTHDYETVFGLDSADFGTRIPFYAKESAAAWRSLVDHIDKFDFSQLEYDVIGRIFERLISPEERHKYGQYYTRTEVVDLINSFCIRYGAASVLDPACGGGTFLVRAYARKRKLAPQLGHAQQITGLFGVDLSFFAAHLTTINLASRDLIDAENYPKIVRSDFFDLTAGSSLPMVRRRNVSTRGLNGNHEIISLGPVDAVVGNPPYVRQEDIKKARNGNGSKLSAGTKQFYLDLVERETGIKLSGRSDLHCYFWLHGATFLKPNGCLGLLTSSQWLDVEYGFKLQGWLLDNFRIIAVMESRVEPWFVGARVATAITIARREDDPHARDNNLVRFVEFRAPLASFVLGDGTSFGMIDAADAFREQLLAIKASVTTDTYRVRVVRQGELREVGVEVGRLISAPADQEKASEDTERLQDDAQSGVYHGGKWGIYLRAPDIWFEILERTQDRWSPLGTLATIRRGLTTGADKFFLH